VADRSSGAGADAIDTRRYLAAIRRDLPLIAALAIGLTIFAVALSLVLPKTYSASALVGFNLTGDSGGDAVTQERNINTQVELVTQTLVLRHAVTELGDEKVVTDVNTLQNATTAEAVFGKNIIQITAKSDEPRLAASFANTIADAYVDQNLADASSALDTEIRSLAQNIKDAPTPELRAQYLTAQQQAIGEKAQNQTQVRIARAATVPGGPDSPKPLRNGVLALFVGIFLGVLLALLRDQLRPRFTTTRDLGQFLEVPVIAAIPELGRRLGVRTAPQAMRVEQESYQSLSAALRLSLPPSETHVLMLTSSMHAEGKTTVATRVARLLAASGHRTLLISGDLRWPRLDALVHVEGKPGFSDLLALEQSSGASVERIRSVIIEGDARDRTSGGADVLPSGTLANDAARLLSSGAVEPLLDKIRGLGYTYVIVDATPLLGLADAKLIARACDRVLVVGRLERISVPAALDLRDELGRIGVPVLGLVAIGGNTEASPYYSGVKFVPAAAGDQPQGSSRSQRRE
jgi:Mrp family chromosome partitioning ATPase/capsular polysaccharide biosynthesis protein